MPGREFVLHSDDLGSLAIGSAVFYRHITAGQVVGYDLDPGGNGVTSFASGNLFVGNSSVGAFQQSTGTFLDSGQLNLGNTTSGTGAAYLSGGVFSASAAVSVGYASAPASLHSSRSTSQLTSPILSFPFISRASSTHAGAMCWQCPHHGA